MLVYKLTDSQKRKLRELEPRLRESSRFGRFTEAKAVAAQIKQVVGALHLRWIQNLIVLIECAINADEIPFALNRSESIRARVADTTRVYVEATTLYCICLLRKERIDEAIPYAREVMRNFNNIKSDRRRRQFQARFIDRIEEEMVLLGLKRAPQEKVDVKSVQDEAIKLLRQKDTNELLGLLASSIPDSALGLLKNIRDPVIQALPPHDQKLLPAHEEIIKPSQLGKKAYNAVQRVVWRVLCDPTNRVNQAWSKGLSIVYDEGWLAASLLTAFGSIGIASKMIIAYVLAIALKEGIAFVCVNYAPKSIIIPRNDRQ